eukprot:CAMPEP_0198613818 /NCGR_PEP_ID=MMETSP1462-20131121/158582_1 /TAXON_ID=1333877 /ORGANISM="Brandtodinium nutriculum, Strain RCC3387" /LENGTH=833 /DNA_ID=CAMNT_0044345621 /DNA_START=27 /DNA_END=2528 /DNA_ORIENTATION=-
MRQLQEVASRRLKQREPLRLLDDPLSFDDADNESIKTEAFEALVTNGRGGRGDMRSPAWSRVCDEDLWNEQFKREVENPAGDPCAAVEQVLIAANATTMVIGHCPNGLHKPTPRKKCNDRLMLADTRMSKKAHGMMETAKSMILDASERIPGFRDVMQWLGIGEALWLPQLQDIGWDDEFVIIEDDDDKTQAGDDESVIIPDRDPEPTTELGPEPELAFLARAAGQGGLPDKKVDWTTAQFEPDGSLMARRGEAGLKVPPLLKGHEDLALPAVEKHSAVRLPELKLDDDFKHIPYDDRNSFINEDKKAHGMMETAKSMILHASARIPGVRELIQWLGNEGAQRVFHQFQDIDGDDEFVIIEDDEDKEHADDDEVVITEDRDPETTIKLGPKPEPAPLELGPLDVGPLDVVSLADLHGDFPQALKIMKRLGVVKPDVTESNWGELGRTLWAAGTATFVQTGDVVDRYHFDKDIIDFLWKLQDHAEAEGGKVVLLLGNHELWNLQGVLQDVRPLARCQYLEDPGDRQKCPAETTAELQQAIKTYGRSVVQAALARLNPWDKDRAKWGKIIGPWGVKAAVAHLKAWDKEGAVGKGVRERLKDGRMAFFFKKAQVLFVHAGLVGPAGEWFLQDGNANAAAELLIAKTMRQLQEVASRRLKQREPLRLLDDPLSFDDADNESIKTEAFEALVTNGRGGRGDMRSPAWSRVCDEDLWNEQFKREVENPAGDPCAAVEQVLIAANATTMVIGHCPNDLNKTTPRKRCGDRLMLADTRMSTGYNAGKLMGDRLWGLRFSPRRPVRAVSLTKEVDWTTAHFEPDGSLIVQSAEAGLPVSAAG